LGQEDVVSKEGEEGLIFCHDRKNGVVGKTEGRENYRRETDLTG